MSENDQTPDSNGSPPANSTADRESQPIDAEAPPRLPFPVVGIGASAGGLEAIGELFRPLRPDAGMAYVMIQHLPPDRASMMVEILSKKTSMPVHEVSDGIAVEPNHVYVIRPGHTLTIENGLLRLGERLATPGNNRPIDDFFRSLAREQRERAIGIILSGMGSNGAAGAQAIKAVGGLCIAQEPESAQYPSMPRHLIDAGYADYILRPGDIADVLLAYADHPYSRGGREADAAKLLSREHQHVREILAVLRTRTRQDFNGYKKPTLLRRIQRRMGLSRLTDVGDYAKLLRQSPSEVTALADDLLIHVTGFFRDPQAWETLRERVIVPLVAAREPEASIRCWVTACSSGEEAYSLAILLAEESERSGKRLDIKVFATDMAERTLQNARNGVYPGGIETEISPARLDRYFQKEDAVYRVRQDLREVVVFAPQNVLQDPPFSRLDIVTCRNLLIYLEPAVQQRVLRLLHFGLREGGTLFLGTSETALAGVDEMFEPLDKKARLFRRIGPTRHGAVDFPLPSVLANAQVTGDRSPAEARGGAGPRASLPQVITRSLLEDHTPAAVAVDRDHRIVFYHGNTEPFLAAPRGEPTRDLFGLARESVRGAIRGALHRAISENAPATSLDGWIEPEPGRRVRVAVTASPLDSRFAPDHFLVSFQERGDVRAESSETPAVTGDEAEEELRRTRDELQSTIEELQTSNEELKASHEEVTSTNEELQSSNEELESSREEMQSLNEELSTVNSQLQAKIEEHQAARNDLSSLLTSTDIAVLFLDTEFRIRRFTPTVKDLLDLIASDIGRPLSDFARKFSDPELVGDAQAAIERLTTSESEIHGDQNRWYLRRITPYRTSDNRIDGVVITFVDITRRKESEESVRRTAERDAFLVVLSDTLRPLTDPGEIRAEASRLLGTRLRASRVAFGDVSPDGRITHEREYVLDGMSPGAQDEFKCYDAALLEQFRAGNTCVVSNVSTNNAVPEQKRSAFEALRIRAHVSVPILEKDHLIGILCVAQSTERKWTPAEVSLIEDVAHRAGDAIARVRAESSLRESEARLAAELTSLKRLHELTERLLASPSLSSALDEVLSAALALHETQMGTIQMLDPVSKSLRLIAQQGFDPALLTSGEGTFGSISTATLRSGQRLIVEDFQKHPDFASDRAMASSLGYRSAQCTPLMTRQGELQGVLTTYARHPHRAPERILQITDLYARLAAHLIERMRVELALLESEQRFRMAIEAARMGFWDWDLTSGKITWEPTHNRLLGLPPEQTDGTFERFMSCVHTDDRAALSETIRNALERGTEYAGDFRAVHADGSVHWIAGFGRPAVHNNGKVTRMIGGVLDITERKQIELERDGLLRREQSARTEAEAANHMKDEFLAALSHELRTPLSAILLWTKLLGDKATPDVAQLREGLAAIKISAEAQKDLIEDLLDTSRIATGKMRLQIKDVELVPVMKDVLDAVSPAAKAKSIRVTTEFDENVGVVQLDAERFRQIAWNLLQNAVKFTPPHGSIEVRLSRDHDEIEIVVKDSGRGITAEFLPQVFERFRQFEATSTRTEGGLGLGLSIVKQLVELHGGTVRAQSAGRNRGATFVVRLPLPKLARSPKKGKRAAPPDTVDLNDSKILIVEDDPATRRALQEVLQNAGARVTAADSASAAMTAVQQSRPDLLISDIGLPGEDGYSLLRSLRAWEETNGAAPMAAVALTAFASDEQRHRALEAGFGQHIGKPIDPDQLLSIVKSLLPESSTAQ